MGVSVCRFKEEGVCLRRLINFGKMIRLAANVSEKTTREPSTVSANQALPVGGPHFKFEMERFAILDMCDVITGGLLPGIRRDGIGR